MFPSKLATFLFIAVVSLLTCSINSSNLSCQNGSQYFTNENANNLSPQKLYKLNDIFQILYKQAQHEQYQHNEDYYKQAKNIVKVIKEATNFVFNQHDQVTLLLGKTGWGKSTCINILNGAKFRITQFGVLQPIDQKQIKTLIGKGDGSTTMFPVCIDTHFGKICDLPGDEQTRGILPQLINAISKKKLGKSLKKIKLVLVVPASVFTAEGSYGSEFKKILAAANKFLGGIDKYKYNMVLLINFADRWQKQFQKVIDNINKTLKHQDGLLNQYKQLIINLLTDKKIKLIAKPSMESEQYNVPQIKGWEDHQMQKITQTIKNLPTKISKQQDFSVPYNPNIIPKLKSFLKIFIQKAKNSIQVSFTTLKISGLQLNYSKDFLKQIRNTKHLSLEQFITQYEKNRYFDVKEVNQVMDEIKFIAQFLDKDQAQLYKADWISQNLQNSITQVIQNIYNVTSEVMLNFRKIAQFVNLNVKQNSQIFNPIDNLVKQLQRLQFQLFQAQIQSKDQNSSFFQDQIIRIYDKTIQQPYQIEQQYIQYEIQQKLYRIPKQEQYQIDVTKERIKYKQQVQKYKQKVPYTKKVPRTQTTVITTKGPRRYLGIVGPRETLTTTTTRTVQVDQVYFIDQQRTRKIKVPYTEYYTQKQKRIKVVQIEQLRQQQVAIQKNRTKILYKQKQLYKNDTMRIFNATKYEQKRMKITQQIQYTVIKIKQMIRNAEKVQLSYKPLLTAEDCKLDFQKNNVQIFYQWFVLQHRAFANKYPYRQIIDANKTEIHAD